MLVLYELSFSQGMPREASRARKSSRTPKSDLRTLTLVARAKPQDSGAQRRDRVHSVARRAPAAPYALRTMFDPANVNKKKEKRVAIQ